MPPSAPGCRTRPAAVGVILFLVGGWVLPVANAQVHLSSSAAQGISCEHRGAEAPQSLVESPLAQPRRSLWAVALRRVGVAKDEQVKDAQVAAQRAACSRTNLDGCSALSPRQPDSSWASPQTHQGLPDTLRPKAEPCVDTWYRLVARRDGWVHFDVTRTDRRPARFDPSWIAPLRIEVSCAALHS